MSGGTSSQPVVVIGAGIAGLSAAVALLGEGRAVTVLERASAPGGKMRQLAVEDRHIDAGPTVFTMRWVFDELLDGVGRSLEDLVTLRPARILARHGWTDGSRFDLPADAGAAAEAVGDFAGSASARGFRAFLRDSAALYRDIGEPFMRSASTSLPAMMKATGPGGAGALLKIQPHKTMWNALARYFPDPRLQQLFGRYATYYGSSPFHCPPNLMLVAHVEQEGVWYIDGGMHRLAQALTELIRDLGGTVRFDAEVAGIETDRGAVQAITLADGERIETDRIILNADAAALGGGRFGPSGRRAGPKPAPQNRSLSAITTATVAKSEGFPLHRHTVFFSDAYRQEFEAIFRDGRVPAQPTTYICAQDRGDEGLEGDVPDGRERLFFLINAPADGDTKTYEAEEIERCRKAMTDLLARCGLTLSALSAETQTVTPTQFEALFPASGGALYGQASHGWGSFFSRPGCRTKLKGLYLAGGSVHPGPGVPTAALSGRIAAGCLTADRG